MNFEENTGILLTAIHFSADRHRDQRRKDSLKSPYINHPIEVAELLWRVGGIRDEAVLLAAVLHAVIHDPVPDIRTLSIGIPEYLAQLVEQLLDKDPARRPQAVLPRKCPQESRADR